MKYARQPKRNATIIQRYMDGASLSKLARAFHLSRSRVYQIILAANVWRPRVDTSPRDNEIRTDLLRGVSIKSVAHKYHLSIWSIYKIRSP